MCLKQENKQNTKRKFIKLYPGYVCFNNYK